MMQLLSLAWWTSRIAGPAGQALVAAAVAGTIVTSIVGGLAWLRHDARSDERAQCNLEQTRALNKAEATLLERLATSERVAREQLAERQRQLDQSQVEAAALQATLDAMPPPEKSRVCYPKALVRSLNK